MSEPYLCAKENGNCLFFKGGGICGLKEAPVIDKTNGKCISKTVKK